MVERDPLELAVEAGHRLIVAYCAMGNETGGELHCVVDDFGLENSTIEAAINSADLHNDEVAMAIGDLLLSLPPEHRARAVSPWLCAKCGHSVILHEERVTMEEGSSATTTAAYRGPCKLDGCDCEHGDPELDD